MQYLNKLNEMWEENDHYGRMAKALIKIERALRWTLPLAVLMIIGQIARYYWING